MLYIVTLNLVQFFAANGFPCPTLHNPSDHYLRIINKDFEMVSKFWVWLVFIWEIKIQWKTWNLYDSFYCLQDDVEEGFGKRVTTEKAIGILLKSYKSSQIRNQVNKEVAKISESVSFMLHSSPS